MSELISDGGVCRTAPATPGLLIIVFLHEWRRLSLRVKFLRGTSQFAITQLINSGSPKIYRF